MLTSHMRWCTHNPLYDCCCSKVSKQWRSRLKVWGLVAEKAGNSMISCSDFVFPKLEQIPYLIYETAALCELVASKPDPTNDSQHAHMGTGSLVMRSKHWFYCILFGRLKNSRRQTCVLGLTISYHQNQQGNHDPDHDSRQVAQEDDEEQTEDHGDCQPSAERTQRRSQALNSKQLQAQWRGKVEDRLLTWGSSTRNECNPQRFSSPPDGPQSPQWRSWTETTFSILVHSFQADLTWQAENAASHTNPNYSLHSI